MHPRDAGYNPAGVARPRKPRAINVRREPNGPRTAGRRAVRDRYRTSKVLVVASKAPPSLRAAAYAAGLARPTARAWIVYVTHTAGDCVAWLPASARGRHWPTRSLTTSVAGRRVGPPLRLSYPSDVETGDTYSNGPVATSSARRGRVGAAMQRQRLPARFAIRSSRPAAGGTVYRSAGRADIGPSHPVPGSERDRCRFDSARLVAAARHAAGGKANR